MHVQPSAARPKEGPSPFTRECAHSEEKEGGGSGGEKNNRLPSTASYLCKPLQAQTVLIQCAGTTATLSERLECLLPRAANGSIHIMRAAAPRGTRDLQPGLFKQGSSAFSESRKSFLCALFLSVS